MKTQEMKIINPQAAGIDVGSKSHYVGVGQSLDQVKEFGVYSSEHQNMIDYLKQHTITMENDPS